MNSTIRLTLDNLEDPTADPEHYELELHEGVACDECGEFVRGFRYKCLECLDYDLCSGCQILGKHRAHILIRIAESLTKNVIWSQHVCISRNFYDFFLENERSVYK